MAFTDWSNSSLTTLQLCGEKFRRRYLERERVPPGLRQLRGTVVHRVASQSLTRKLIAQTLPSREEAEDLAADAWRAEVQGGVLYEPEEIERGVKAATGEAQDYAVAASGFHVVTVAPQIEPVAVERRITVKPRDAAITIAGTIDLVARGPKGEQIRDLKTSEKSPPATAADTSQQLTMYGLIRFAETGTLPAEYALDYVVRTPKRHEEKHVQLTTTRDRTDLETLVRRINTAVRAVEAGVFVPANPDSWLCTVCEYRESCPYVHGRRVVAANGGPAQS